MRQAARGHDPAADAFCDRIREAAILSAPGDRAGSVEG